MRLDKYLKVSRLIKRRTVANEVCSMGRVQINSKVAKPSSEVIEGDMLDILMSGKHLVVKVLSVREFAPKEQAGEMYQVISGIGGKEDV